MNIVSALQKTLTREFPNDSFSFEIEKDLVTIISESRSLDISSMIYDVLGFQPDSQMLGDCVEFSFDQNNAVFQNC
jgi:hypothetical protein